MINGSIVVKNRAPCNHAMQRCCSGILWHGMKFCVSRNTVGDSVN